MLDEIVLWNAVSNKVVRTRKFTYCLLLGHRKMRLHLFHYLEDLNRYNIIFVVLQIW